MISERYIQDLLPILKAHGVKHVKMQGLELTFHVEHSESHTASAPENNPKVTTKDGQEYDHLISSILKQEKSLPVDLRVESINNQETILNWSSPDQKPIEEEPEIPLTGEQPL